MDIVIFFVVGDELFFVWFCWFCCCLLAGYFCLVGCFLCLVGFCLLLFCLFVLKDCGLPFRYRAHHCA